MPPKGWKKNQDEQLAKKKESVSKEQAVVTQKIEEITVDTNEKQIVEEVAQTMGAGSKATRERLPKITISYYDKTGYLVTKQYTCTTIRIAEDSNTVLTGGQPTKSALSVHLSVDCDVVEIQ